MAVYMLLLYNDPSWYKALSPEEMQKATEKYMAWSKSPFVKDSKRLAGDPGKVIRPPAGGQARTVDGPYSETKEVLGGYYAIEAASYEEAVKHALTIPHLEYGGTVEIRHVFGT